MRQGRLAEAEAALRQALALRPDFALPHSNILFCLNYRPDVSAEDIFAEYRRWDRQHALPLLPAHRPASNSIGRRSGDCASATSRPTSVSTRLRCSRSRCWRRMTDRLIELYCYAEVPSPDAVTERFHALADHWHSTVGLSDAELAEQIRRDRIDVLVDLAGHTAGNRLLTFARKPAPVQVTWLLGHGYTSGLSAMDAFLADAELAPPGADGLFSERLIRLSRIPLAYAPPAEMPDVAPLPALANGCITFGYFGRTVRLNDARAGRLGAHSARRARLATDAEQCAVRRAGRPRTDVRALRGTRHRSGTARCLSTPRRSRAPGRRMARSTSRSTRFRTMPAPRRSRRCGRACRSCRSPAGRRWDGSAPRSCTRSGWMTGSPAMSMPTWRAPSRPRRISTRWRGCARNCARASQPRRCATPPDWHARSRRPIAPCGDAWCDDDDRDVRQRLCDGRRGRRRPPRRATLLAEDPHDAAALHVLGLIKFSHGDAAAAAALLQRSVDAAPDAAVLSDLGVMLRASGRLAEAEAAYRRALQLDPSLVQALGNLGNVLLDLHRADEAEAVLTEALRARAGPALAVAQPRAEPDGVRRAGSCRSLAAAGAGDRSRRMPRRMRHSAPCSVSRADRSRPKGIIEPRCRRRSSVIAFSPIWRSCCRHRADMPKPSSAVARHWRYGLTTPSRTAICCSRSTTATT